jgi:GTPase SAR1 family protein
MNTTDADYASYQEHRDRLAALLQQTQKPLGLLNLQGWLDTVGVLTDRVRSDRFKVLVLGEFKRGKSTFINAMLGQEVLPAYALPCTAVINEVKWGEKPAAMLHFRHPLPDRLPDRLPTLVRRHLDRAGRRPAAPIEIPVGELEQYVVIQDPGRDQAQSVAETPYDRVELFWPLDLCKNGVEIIDSPGLNEHGVRTKVTLEYLGKADAVIFVMSSTALAGLAEMQFLDTQVRGSGHEYVFLVCTRIDEVRERDRPALMKFGRDKLADRTKFGEAGVFFVSAIQALEGRPEASGLAPLEHALASFLVHDRGRVKLLQPARNLAQATKVALFEAIPGQRKMLSQDLDELQRRYDEKRPLLDQAEKQRSALIERLERQRRALAAELAREGRRYLVATSAKLSDWAAEFEPRTSINILNIPNLTRQFEELSKEIVVELSSRLERDQAAWKQTDFLPIIETRLHEMERELDISLTELLADLDKIRTDMSGLKATSDVEEAKIGGLHRVLAGAGGLLLGGPDVAFAGALGGSMGMLKSLLPNIALVAGMLIIGLTNPFVILAALLGKGLIEGLLKTRSLVDRAKLQVAKEMAVQLREQSADMAEAMAEAINGKTSNLVEAVNSGLEKQIQDIRNQVESVLRAKRAGEAEVRRRHEALDEIEKEIQAIDGQLTSIIFALAHPRRAG